MENTKLSLNEKPTNIDELKKYILEKKFEKIIINYSIFSKEDSPFANLVDIKNFSCKIEIGEQCLSLNELFFNCKKLEVAPELNTKYVCSFEGMFEECRNIITVPLYDLTSAKNTSRMFKNCTSLIELPNFKHSQIDKCERFIQGCSAMIAIPTITSPILFIDTDDDVTDVLRLQIASLKIKTIEINCDIYRKLIYGQFVETSSPFSGILSLTKINFEIIIKENCHSLEGLFYGCKNLEEAPNLQTSNITNFNSMFYDCEQLTKIPNYETKNVVSMQNTFHGCKSLTKLPFWDTSSVTNMFGMIECCSRLKEIPKFNTISVKNLSWFASSCSSLISFPSLNTKNVTEMCSIFNKCTNLKEIPLLSIRHVQDIDKIFNGYSNKNVCKKFWGLFKWRYITTKIFSFLRKIIK